MNKLSIVQQVAVGTVIKNLDEVKKTLPVGVHQVDCVVHIKGAITKGASTIGVIAQKAEPWKLLAAALSKLNGVTVEALVKEAEELPEDQMETLKKNVAAALNTIKGSTTGTISGKTTTALVAELVETTIKTGSRKATV